MMALALVPERDIRKIVGSAALLRSPHDGEVVAAARAVDRLLAPHGLRVETLVEAAFAIANAPAPLPDNPTPGPDTDHQSLAEWCLEIDRWNRKERAFLESVARLRSLSPKQTKWLHDICGERGWHL